MSARVPVLPAPVTVLGHAVHPIDLPAAASWVLSACGVGERVDGSTRALVVTINPEMVVRARLDAELADAVAGAALVVADGVGITWAAGVAGHRLPGRVPGVDLVSEVLAVGGDGLRVAFVGGRPGVAQRAAEVAASRWGTRIASVHHGYFDVERDGAAIAAEVADGGAALVLAGLGERQEVFLWRHRHALGHGVAVGVGGTLDVLAGTVVRSPAWTRRLGVEWAYRVGLDPRRWRRAPRLAAFARLVLAERMRPGRGRPT